jgi:hypothetical protein
MRSYLKLRDSSWFISAKLSHLYAHANSVQMAIRLKILGTDDNDPSEYIVIFCQQYHVKRVQQFFRSDLIKSLYEPLDNLVPKFKVLINGTAPALKSSKTGFVVTVLYDQSAKDRNSLCVLPIYILDRSNNIRGKATVRGLI